jgi:hypothetical protein
MITPMKINRVRKLTINEKVELVNRVKSEVESNPMVQIIGIPPKNLTCRVIISQAKSRVSKIRTFNPRA